jgi:hypothetical protein
MFQRCTAITIKGKRCAMDVVSRGETLCKAHHPDHSAAWKADCKRRIQEYRKRRRAAEAAKATTA